MATLPTLAAEQTDHNSIERATGHSGNTVSFFFSAEGLVKEKIFSRGVGVYKNKSFKTTAYA